MNRMSRRIVCLLGVGMLSPAFAVLVETVPPAESFELNADAVRGSAPEFGVEEKSIVPEPSFVDRYLLNMELLFPHDEASGIVVALSFLDAPGLPKQSQPAPVVPEPPTGALVLMGLAILVLTQRVAPVNLRTVHSRLRARRGHVPIR